MLDVDPDTLSVARRAGVRVSGTVIAAADATHPLPHRPSSAGSGVTVLSVTSIDPVDPDLGLADETDAVGGAQAGARAGAGMGGPKQSKPRPRARVGNAAALGSGGRSRRQLDAGGRKVMIMCVTMKNGTGPGVVRPSYCDETALRALFFDTGNPGATLDGFYRATSWGGLSFPAELIDYVEVEVDSVSTSDSCEVRRVSTAADVVATGLDVMIERRGAWCRDTTYTSDNGHGYGTPAQCALRCMCDVEADAPSGVRLFSLDDSEDGSYACRCSRQTGSTCIQGYLDNANYNTYSFSVNPAAVVSEAQFCEAGNHRIYAMPYEYNACTFGAAAYVCGDDSKGPCQAYLRGPWGYALAHELGHNLGLYHASGDHDNDGRQLSTEEYADPSDVMGQGFFPFANTFNAPHLLQLGLLPADRVTALVPADGCTRTVTLTPLSVDPAASSGVHTVAIPRAASIGGGTYYVAFRLRTGFDAGMGLEVANKVSVTYQITPTANTRLVGMVLPGIPFEDSASALRITTDVVACSDAASVDIAVDMCWDGISDGGGGGGGDGPDPSFELVIESQLCITSFPVRSLASDTTTTLVQCSAICANTCGCQYFSHHATTGSCFHANTTSDCCRGSLYGDSGGYSFFKLSAPATPYPGICSAVQVSGISEYDGDYSLVDHPDFCGRSYTDATGEKSIYWSGSRMAWCLDQQGETVCTVYLSAPVDDPSASSNTLTSFGAPIAGTAIICMDSTPDSRLTCGTEGCRRRGNRVW